MFKCSVEKSPDVVAKMVVDAVNDREVKIITKLGIFNPNYTFNFSRFLLYQIWKLMYRHFQQVVPLMSVNNNIEFIFSVIILFNHYFFTQNIYSLTRHLKSSLI
jgi:hypothetical protein